MTTQEIFIAGITTEDGATGRVPERRTDMHTNEPPYQIDDERQVSEAIAILVRSGVVKWNRVTPPENVQVSLEDEKNVIEVEGTLELELRLTDNLDEGLWLTVAPKNPETKMEWSGDTNGFAFIMGGSDGAEPKYEGIFRSVLYEQAAAAGNYQPNTTGR
jgi:hypothetical protein